MLYLAPAISTLPDRLLNSGARSGLSGEDIHLLKGMLEGELDRGVGGKGGVQSVHGG